VAGFGREDDFIAMRREIFVENFAKIVFGRARWWAVVVGEIEVRDASIEGPHNHIASGLGIIDITKIMPKTKRNIRK